MTKEWQGFKQTLVLNNLNFVCNEDEFKYDLETYLGNIPIYCCIPKDRASSELDQLDFEANFLSKANSLTGVNG